MGRKPSRKIWVLALIKPLKRPEHEQFNFFSGNISAFTRIKTMLLEKKKLITALIQHNIKRIFKS